MKKNSFLQHNMALLLEPVRGYSRVVSVTKLGFTVLAFLLIALLIILPLFSPVHENFRLTYKKVENNGDEGKPRMIKPRFQGVDGSDQPYNISAKYAQQDSPDIISLNEINADINLNDDSWISMIAAEGILDRAKKTADLIGDVGFYSTTGYELATKDVHIDIDKLSAYGNDPVNVISEGAVLKSDSFYIENKGEKIAFQGNVKLTIYPALVK